MIAKYIENYLRKDVYYWDRGDYVVMQEYTKVLLSIIDLIAEDISLTAVYNIDCLCEHFGYKFPMSLAKRYRGERTMDMTYFRANTYNVNERLNGME